MSKPSFNRQVAAQLDEMAHLLQQQGANAFRVNAYRRAAHTVTTLETDLRDLVSRGGAHELEGLPTIGAGIAAAIIEIANTGRWVRLERLRGELDPVHALQSLPFIGPELAERIHSTLQVDTLEGLHWLAERGRLQRVPGIGPRREAAIRAALAARLSHPRRLAVNPSVHPPVALLLEIDRRYRELAAADRLPRIAPARFNPEGVAWLPVLHEDEQEWHFTVLFSNTARAHELGHTHDWVVIYYYDGYYREGQCTVVTEPRGVLAGKRVVRGDERACERYYGESNAAEREHAPH